MNKKILKKLPPVFGVTLMAAMPQLALAGEGGEEFASLTTMVTGWLDGELGRLIAISFFGIGILVGLVRQSLMAAITGVGCAVVISFLPGIIGGIITAEATPEQFAAFAAAAL